MKTLYTQMVNKETQKSHPFGLAERRFKWVNLYSNGNDLHRKNPPVSHIKDNIEGSLGRFLNKNMEEYKKEQEIKKNMVKNNKNKNYCNSMEKNNGKYNYKHRLINSERVIYPEKDTEITKIHKKRTYGSVEKDLLHTTDGNLMSLINKTPINFEYKGKKKFLNNSVDNSRREDTNLFSDDFLNDKKYNRIPGVKRKHLVSNINVETKPYDASLHGRKHFYNKAQHDSIIY